MSLTLASAIYPGETKTIDNTLNDLNLTWSIQDNDTMINGLVVKITLEKINITFPGDMPPYSFNILFQSEEYEEEVVASVYHSSGGGSSSSSSSSIIYVVDNVSGKDYGDASKYPTYNDKEIAKEDLPEEEQITIELITEEGKLHWILWLLGGVLILLTIYFIFSRNKSHSLVEEEHTNEENLS